MSALKYNVQDPVGARFRAACADASLCGAFERFAAAAAAASGRRERSALKAGRSPGKPGEDPQSQIKDKADLLPEGL